jgi:membrane protein insertase Oxa1/YidC/SpoIIIJ
MDTYQRQMGALLTKHDVKPYLIFAFPLAQLPIFMSMFFGMRRAHEAFPAETASGGMLWFPDLSVADPTYALPLITSGLFLLMIEVGADGMNAAGDKSQAALMKNVMRGMGIMMVPFTYHFPASVFCYWVSANTFSLGQTVLLNKIPGVREALGIPIVHTPSKVRKPTAPPVETVFGRLEKALDQVTGRGGRGAARRFGDLRQKERGRRLPEEPAARVHRDARAAAQAKSAAPATEAGEEGQAVVINDMSGSSSRRWRE